MSDKSQTADLLALDDEGLVAAAYEAADELEDPDDMYAVLGEVFERFAVDALKATTRRELGDADDYLDFLNGLASRAAFRPLARALAS